MNAAWIKLAAEAVTAAQTVESGLATLFAHVKNEMAHGGGLTNPQAIADDLVAGVDELAAALQSTPAATAVEQPGSTAAVGEVQTEGTVAAVGEVQSSTDAEV